MRPVGVRAFDSACTFAHNHVRAASVKEVMPKLLREEFWSPLLIIKVLEKEPARHPALWPVITESLAHAAR